MRHLLMLTAAFGLVLSVAAPASAQHMDAKGRCHDEHGRYAKADVCKTAHHDEHAYKMDGKGKCRDERGRFAKNEMCHH